MSIVLTGRPREQFRAALQDHRARSLLTDADYARTILRVSLNTFKKCIGPATDLSLKRLSFNSIVANTGLDPSRFGSKAPMPISPREHGGYTKSEYGYLTGRYLLYRRSFQNGVDINRAVLDIVWNEPLSCLSFKELRRRKNDNGVWDANDFSGQVFMHPERVLMSLLAIENGDVRLTLLHIPPRHVYGTNLGLVRTSGAVLTHGYPKRFYQPVVSAITIEAVDPAKRSTSPNALCKTLKPGHPEYGAAAEDLRIAEEHAIVLTPLMWRSAQASPR
jgi:hypothetical protein